MRKNTHTANVWQGSLNTLAQNGTAGNIDIAGKHDAIIVGEGSELGNDKVLKGRAKRKVISGVMALTLVDIAGKKENSERKQSFWNTYHCQNRVYSHEGRYYGKYCKNRHCLLCCSIRKADIINRYLPVMRNWDEPQFVTLTVKAVKKEQLSKAMEKLIKGFRRINSKYRKRYQRGQGIKLTGIKSLECNFNHAKNSYNPHLHLIVANKETANILVNEWLSLWTAKWTNRKAQFIRPVESMERDLIETIKYGSKIFTEPDVTKKSISKVDSTVYAAALYNIFEAMKGLRIFDRFGFNLPKTTPKQKIGARVVNDYYEWVFVPEWHDWLNTENELTLTGYCPPAKLINLLGYNIDINSE